MNEKIYVDSLFSSYDDTESLRDFKEEITTNMKEKVDEFTKDGLSRDDAFNKAALELGDITKVADGLANKKRYESIGSMYFKTRKPFTKRNAAGITLATFFLLLSVGMFLIDFFSGNNIASPFFLSAIFLSVSSGLYTYFILTTETNSSYAMENKRALAYALTATFGFLGASLSVISFLFEQSDLSSSLMIKLIFILPAICTLIYLLITQEKRYKPWLQNIVDSEIEESINFNNNMVDPRKAAIFGIMSGALWLFVIAIFITFGFFVSWKTSWIILLFALPVQVLMITSIFKKDN